MKTCLSILFNFLFLIFIVPILSAQGSLTPVRNTSPQSTIQTQIRESVQQNSDAIRQSNEVNEEQAKKISELELSLKSANENLENLKTQLEKDIPKPVDEKYFDTVVWIAFTIFIGWVILMLAYYFWAVRYHVVNYGLSKKMWKIYYPEALASDKEKDKLAAKRNEMVARRNQEALAEAKPGEEFTPITTPFDAPKENKYKNDSFGLPPGTIRGTLALTALVMFIIIEAVNFFSPHSLEGHFEGLVTALQMVLAFYFGSKAVDVLKARTDKKAAEAKPIKPAEEELLKRVVSPGGKPDEVDDEAPEELPKMPSGLSSERLITVNDQEKDEEAPPADDTWQKSAELSTRVLALTAAFETSRSHPECFGLITGNFDNQGISFGALQWNIGQGSLQPLLNAMLRNHETVAKDIFGNTKFEEIRSMLLMSKSEQMEWAKKIQFHRTLSTGRTVWRIEKEWKKIFNELGRTHEMIELQADAAKTRYNIALSNCDRFELNTERGVALMFDINVQNGRVDRNGAGDRIFEDYLKILNSLSEEKKQIEKMKIIAHRRSEVSYVRWRDDVLVRKMTIAEGIGTVHGMQYDLGKDYNITLKQIV